MSSPSPQDRIDAFLAWVEAQDEPDHLETAKYLSGRGEDEFIKNKNRDIYSLGRWDIYAEAVGIVIDCHMVWTINGWSVTRDSLPFQDAAFSTLRQAKDYVIEQHMIDELGFGPKEA